MYTLLIVMIDDDCDAGDSIVCLEDGVHQKVIYHVGRTQEVHK